MGKQQTLSGNHGNGRSEMWKQIRKTWRRLKSSRSGERFQSLYRSRQKRNRGGYCLTDFLMTLLGCFLMLFGLAIGWLPGPGGFVGIIGLAIVAQQFQWVAKLLDALEHGIVGLWNRLASQFRPSSVTTKEQSTDSSK